VGAVALPLTFAGGTTSAAPQPAAAPSREAPEGAAGTSSWVADELRILRAEVEAMRQRPETSVASDIAALRREVARLAAAQSDLERRLGVAPAAVSPVGTTERSGGVSLTVALVFLFLGAAIGWVSGRLTQRWRDRRQRIRV
jgi:hypothetical protein